MKRLFVLLILAGSLLLAPTVARAESIQSITTKVDVSQAGQANFNERIVYDLPSGRHGIYRDIPISTQTSDGKYLNYDLAVNSITRANASEPYSLIGQGSFEQLKIGSVNKTFDAGVQTYVIDYTLSPFVRKDSAGDYITVNLHGTLWDVGAKQVTGSVTLPTGVKIQSSQCFTGAQGARETNCTITAQGENAVLVQANSALPPNAGLTVDLVVPAGSFQEAAYLVPSDTAKTAGSSSGSSKSNPWLMIGIFLLAFGSTIFALVRAGIGAAKRRAKRRQQTVVAQYEAPDGTTPGEVGLLSDEVGDSREITATLIDLARRGFLKITYLESPGLFGKKQDFKLSRLPATASPADYIKVLLDALFAGGEEMTLGSSDKNAAVSAAQLVEVPLSSLDKTKMASAAKLVQVMLKDRMKARGWFMAHQSAFSTENLTPTGYQEWAKVEGLKLYLNVAEKDRINFAEAPAKTPERFTKLLPYAIALGVEKEWAKQFEGIDVSPATQGWYGGNNVGNSLLFTNMLSDSFATSVSSNFTPPSSSGGAGGGFSGGGGGGGGGGSW